MNVIEEKSLKDTRRVNLFFLLFWTSLYQLITVWALFWVDIIPNFGFAHSVENFGEKLVSITLLQLYPHDDSVRPCKPPRGLHEKFYTCAEGLNFAKYNYGGVRTENLCGARHSELEL